MKNFENKIKKLAIDNNLTVEELARKCKISTTTLYNIFKSNSANTRTLELISEVTNTPISFFYEDENMLKDEQAIYNIGYKNQIIKGDNSKIANADQLKEIEFLKRENDQLKQQLADKQKLIEIYERELSNISKKN